MLESEARRSGFAFPPFDITLRRRTQPFRSLADFIQRTKAEQRMMESLIQAGLFDSMGERRQLLWDLGEAFVLTRRPSPTLFDVPDERAQSPPMPLERKLALTFATTGVTAGPHLVEMRRDAFTKAGCVPYRDPLKLRSGAKVRVGGLVADGLRRPPTAHGTSFLRLEDSDGLIDVIVSPQVYAECREALHAAFLVVDGALQRNGPTLTVMAQKLARLEQGLVMTHSLSHHYRGQIHEGQAAR